MSGCDVCFESRPEYLPIRGEYYGLMTIIGKSEECIVTWSYWWEEDDLGVGVSSVT